MNRHFVRDTRPEIGQCARCQEVVLLCQVNGFKVAADTLSLTVDDYRQAVIDNRQTYDVVERDGKLHRLKPRTAAVAYRDGLYVVRDHGCGAAAAAPSTKQGPATPPQAPATPGSDSAGLHQPPAPARGSPTTSDPNPAAPATHPPFKRRVATCDDCRHGIYENQLHVMATHGRTVHFARHADPQDCVTAAGDVLWEEQDYDALHSMPWALHGRPIDDVPLPATIRFEEK
ncbi:hypothetical protein OV450_3403 [Actinobacteria bacterium OV450]|nr:hypothetical protein OV450_3403 [Actinobacteria bacterium OV450]